MIGYEVKGAHADNWAWGVVLASVWLIVRNCINSHLVGGEEEEEEEKEKKKKRVCVWWQQGSVASCWVR